LEPYKEKISLVDAAPFVTALFDIGDQLPEGEPGFFSLGVAIHVSRIVYWFLRQEEDPGKRADILRQGIKETRGVSLPVDLVSIDCQRHDRGKDPSEFLVAEKDIGEFSKLCLGKITAAAQDCSLLRHRDMLSLLYDWQRWESKEATSEWVQQAVSTDDGLLAFLRGVRRRGASSGMESYHTTVHRYIPLSSVESFVEPTVIERRIKELADSRLSTQDQIVIHEFRTAVRRREEGRDDNDWRHDSREARPPTE